MASPRTVRPPADRSGTDDASRGARSVVPALAADALLIVLFAALGRRAHASGLDLAGILWTALPFLLAWAATTALTRPRRTWARPWPAGVVVWLGTVAGGLVLRVLLGETAAPSFQLVTAAVLGAFLLGRRGVTALLTRPRRGSRT
ncbi:DUF3054 domain-containing protein [Citricoccus sp. SGAir0253]|uniref:DUF3054 domain-containing protein n=1 Tax=Citricoccus sp. SGAir0253 TaxID=2567881 RepID=UPI0010CCCB9A|nr:DUF3054 domain-containing protein [Citricoccus sp. SGAir0253]QCU78030.1 DUF3054 domain-containing protein [Citricoccus sp. SGAir0253]